MFNQKNPNNNERFIFCHSVTYTDTQMWSITVDLQVTIAYTTIFYLELILTEDGLVFLKRNKL